jgi:preprotein translocase subunit SecE
MSWAYCPGHIFGCNLGREFFVSSILTIRPTILIKMMKLKVYLQEAYDELVHKVTWPTWKELQNSALVVMVASFIISLLIFIMDKVFENIMNFIYGLFY